VLQPPVVMITVRAHRYRRAILAGVGAAVMIATVVSVTLGGWWPFNRDDQAAVGGDLATCGGQPFDVTVLDQSPQSLPATTDDATLQALGEFNQSPEGLGDRLDGFIVLHRTESEVLYGLHLDGELAWDVTVADDGSGWRAVGWATCTPQPFREGMYATRWGLAATPSSDAEHLDIIVSTGICVGSTEVHPHEIEVTETETTFVITAFVHNWTGPGDCAGLPREVAARVTVGAAVADRQIRDGGNIPPTDASMVSSGSLWSADLAAARR
jgi:hypothetical protein